jgi:hypothetical protein
VQTGQDGLANRRIQPLCHLSAANVLQHCSLHADSDEGDQDSELIVISVPGLM